MSEPLNNKPETPRQLPKLCKECRCVLWTRSATCSCSCHRMPEETYKQPETPRPEMPVLKKLQWDLHDFLESLIEHGDQAISEPAKWLLQSVDAIKQKLRPEMGKGAGMDGRYTVATEKCGCLIRSEFKNEGGKKWILFCLMHKAAASGTESAPEPLRDMIALAERLLAYTNECPDIAGGWRNRIALAKEALKSQPSSLTPDDPELDATDLAHPAWWRGHEHSVATECQKINQILDGKDDGRGMAPEPWESTRRRLITLASSLTQAGPGWVSVKDGLPAVQKWVNAVIEHAGHREVLPCFLQANGTWETEFHVTEWQRLPDLPVRAAQSQKGGGE